MHCENQIPTIRDRICGYFLPNEARRLYGYDTSLIEESDEEIEHISEEGESNRGMFTKH